jgi:Flp pilus assembly pilin Flp
MLSRSSHASCDSFDPAPRLARDLRGAVFVEYVILVGLVGFGVALMLVSLGPSIVREYSARRGTLYSHSP